MERGRGEVCGLQRWERGREDVAGLRRWKREEGGGGWCDEMGKREGRDR